MHIVKIQITGTIVTCFCFDLFFHFLYQALMARKKPSLQQAIKPKCLVLIQSFDVDVFTDTLLTVIALRTPQSKKAE